MPPTAHLLRRCCCGPGVAPGSGARLLPARHRAGGAWGLGSSSSTFSSSSRSFSAAAQRGGSAVAAASSALLQEQQQRVAPPSAAYVHLPFCKRKCFYCDFPVEAVGANPGKDRIQSRMSAYVDTLLREVEATAVLNNPTTQPLQTVYFGGGTPSLVRPPLLERILSALRDRFGVSPGAEVTIEADPGTFDAALLREYRRLGFTRLSVGVQSFDENLLQTCGRAHTLSEAQAALKAVAASGFPTWSLDLMSGLPGLTRSSWRAALQSAISAGPPHISVYDLQIEEGTPFARKYSPGDAPLPPDDDAASMYADASEALTAAGYEHYEVSNYAKPGHRSRHNQAYWKGGQYYAFGVGAASYLEGRRYSRPKGLPDYEAWVARFEAAAAAGGLGAGLPGAELVPETKEERLLDAIMLGLRTADGIDLTALAADYGLATVQRILKPLERRAAQGLVQLTAGDSPVGDSPQGASPEAAVAGGSPEARALPVRARLKDPEGFLLSNDIISDVFAVL